jgi:hypothetical protein
MIDIFKKTIDLSNIICHSGGAVGSDTYFETIGEKFGVKTKAYSYKTPKHQSLNKVEISDDDYNEGISEVNKANKILGRFGINKYMNLLARNWAQVKYSDEIFAIGAIVDPGKKGGKGYYNKSKYQVVDGGTGYAVQMGINNEKVVYVFDQLKDKWFRWSYTSFSFVEMSNSPDITSQNFAGIGTREILPNGINAIKQVYKKTFNNED